MAAAATAPTRVLPRAKAKMIKRIRLVLDTLEENQACSRETLALVVGPLREAAERAQAEALARRAAPAAPGSPATPPT